MGALIRLHPGIVILFQKGFEEFPVKGIVEVQAKMVLATVQNLYQQFVFSRPRDPAEVSVLPEVRAFYFDMCSAAAFLDPEAKSFTFASCVRVFDLLEMLCLYVV